VTTDIYFNFYGTSSTVYKVGPIPIVVKEFPVPITITPVNNIILDPIPITPPTDAIKAPIPINLP
jgi:hypothetical protein